MSGTDGHRKKRERLKWQIECRQPVGSQERECGKGERREKQKEGWMRLDKRKESQSLIKPAAPFILMNESLDWSCERQACWWKWHSPAFPWVTLKEEVRLKPEWGGSKLCRASLPRIMQVHYYYYYYSGAHCRATDTKWSRLRLRKLKAKTAAFADGAHFIVSIEYLALHP